jgi:hypothetical protein
MNNETDGKRSRLHHLQNQFGQLTILSPNVHWATVAQVQCLQTHTLKCECAYLTGAICRHPVRVLARACLSRVAVANLAWVGTHNLNNSSG